MKSPFLYGFRHSEEHSEDIKEIIKFVQHQAKNPVWLIGTSRGTESAMSVGLKLQGLEGLQGLVLTSTILARDVDEKTNIPVQLLPVNDLQLPVLIVHHELDGCKYSLYSDLPKLRSQLNPKAFTEILSITGGTTGSSPCEGLHTIYLGRFLSLFAIPSWFCPYVRQYFHLPQVIQIWRQH
jgi:hypothetical protein